MASSTSLRKGQIPTSCKLCETETKISWKCMDCNILMCNKCKERIHPNLRNAENHKVVDIEDIGQSEDVNFNNIPSKVHKGQVCGMMCNTCDQLVCPKCIAQTHKGHGFQEISEGYQSCMQKLKIGKDQMNIKMDKLVKRKTKIMEIKKNETGKHMDTKKKIQAHATALKKAVDKYSENLMKELNQIWERSLNFIEKEESKIITLEKQTKYSSYLIEDIIQSKDAERIFEMGQQLEILLEEEEESVEISFTDLPTFVPGEISQINVGSFIHSTDITLKVIKEYTTDISVVLRMSPTKESLWISDQNVVQKVHPDENSLQSISRIDVKMIDMNVTRSNDLLVAPFRQPVLKQMSGKTINLTETKYSVDPLVLTAVHVTNDGKIMVAARNSGEPFPVTGRRAVITMDQEGRHTATFEYDKNKQPIFTYPDNITTTHTGNIFVVDWLSSDSTGRVVVLGQDSDINTYNGHPNINTEDKPFQPASIKTTPSDNIIIPDHNTGVLHILNNNGHYITHINTRNIGIQDPYSVVFTSTGKVYIGCTKAKESTDNAKLYEVKLSGC